MEKKYYTTGEFAKKAGVTIRTIRYYDKIGLLEPSYRGENGYRYYKGEDFAVLQNILTLKFLGLPLEDIRETFKDGFNKDKLKISLEDQINTIESSIIHLKMISKAIEETKSILNGTDEVIWDKCINIINAISEKDIVMQQYKNSDNLRDRINIHDKFSTNKYGFHKWFFDNISFPQNANVLEIGCGNATFWLKNIDRIPKDCSITLSDISEGMIKEAKNNLKGHEDIFNFMILDGNEFDFNEEKFDIVIADHVLYYIDNREEMFNKIKKILKPNGTFYATTIGENHMKEIKDLAVMYNKEIKIEKVAFYTKFGLENGNSQLSKYFKYINKREYEDSLIIDDPKAILSYLYSTHGNLQDIIKGKKRDFDRFVTNYMNEHEKLFVNKSTGIFICKN